VDAKRREAGSPFDADSDQAKRLLEDLVAEVPSDRRSTRNPSGLNHFAAANN
jgi:hypothetical protein